MLEQLRISNVAIIDDLSVELDAGLSVLSGETGAGKSILIDSLGLLLGDRADAGVIRSGAERAEIEGRFLLEDNPRAGQWLESRDLRDPDEPNTLVIRRVVGADGRSRAYINGVSAPIRDLRDLGERLLDIHGQHAHQSLMRADVQRQLLDDYAGHAKLIKAVRSAAQDCRAIQRQLDMLVQHLDGDDSRVDFLKFQVEELDALSLGDNELATLDVEHRKLANAGRILDDGVRAAEVLYDADDNSIYDQLNTAIALLQGLIEAGPAFRDAAALADSAQIQIREAADALHNVLDGLELDPARLQVVEQRLADIHDLARKHRIEPAQLPARLTQFREELDMASGASEKIVELREQLDVAEAQWRKAATKLSASRAKAAAKLGAAVTDEIRGLGIPEGRFEIGVATLDDAPVHTHGADEIRYTVSANAGQSPAPLAKVASGGELSRISLAIQVVTLDQSPVPTLVFDEVDTGIGGGVAEIVGRRLRTISSRCQVMCVTHLPQVAAQGHQHLYVAKQVVDEHTRTSVRRLGDDERTEELARMLGGVEITEQTRAHAREMMAQAQN